jgi:acylphosphatase
MLKLAIIRKLPDGRFNVILEGEDGEFIREIASRIKRILGPKRSFTSGEIGSAVEKAFNENKKEFKEKTVRLP